MISSSYGSAVFAPFAHNVRNVVTAGGVTDVASSNIFAMDGTPSEWICMIFLLPSSKSLSEDANTFLGDGMDNSSTILQYSGKKLGIIDGAEGRKAFVHLSTCTPSISSRIWHVNRWDFLMCERTSSATTWHDMALISLAKFGRILDADPDRTISGDSVQDDDDDSASSSDSSDDKHW